MSSGSRMTMFSHKSDDSELDSESENDNDDDHGCLIDSSNFKVEHLLMIGKCTTNITSKYNNIPKGRSSSTRQVST